LVGGAAILVWGGHIGWRQPYWFGAAILVGGRPYWLETDILVGGGHIGWGRPYWLETAILVGGGHIGWGAAILGQPHASHRRTLAVIGSDFPDVGTKQVLLRCCHQDVLGYTEHLSFLSLLMNEFISLMSHRALLTLLPPRSLCDFTSRRVHRTWLGLRASCHGPDDSS